MAITFVPSVLDALGLGLGLSADGVAVEASPPGAGVDAEGPSADAVVAVGAGAVEASWLSEQPANRATPRVVRTRERYMRPGIGLLSVEVEDVEVGVLEMVGPVCVPHS